MKELVKVSIPDDLSFSELRLARENDGHVSFDWTVIERICQASGLPVKMFRESPEDNVAGLIVGWYREHVRQGGTADPVAEDLIVEVVAEERVGQKDSLPPGRA